MAWIYVVHPIISAISTHGVDLLTVIGTLSKAGRCRIAGCPRHGWRGQAYKDVLAASPQSDTAPP
ncbi:hypothetical protein, partial [Stenotrophomonas lactitubi]|uniref:hypothetical protein n=3 Tax=Lysobacteraceae TaxID=32033 RepID=UPI001E28BD22